MIKIITVLRTGGEYLPEHVYAIENMCKEHITLPHTFHCISDTRLSCDTIPVKHTWPGWWTKLELFMHEGPCLYFDLDTIICNNIDDFITSLMEKSQFAMLRCCHAPHQGSSGIMFWNGDHKYMYDEFVAGDTYHIINQFGGDQNFLRHILAGRKDQNNRTGPDYVDYIQDFAPEGAIPNFFDHKRPGEINPTLDRGRHYDPDFHMIVYFYVSTRPWKQDIIPYKKYLPTLDKTDVGKMHLKIADLDYYYLTTPNQAERQAATRTACEQLGLRNVKEYLNTVEGGVHISGAAGWLGMINEAYNDRDEFEPVGFFEDDIGCNRALHDIEIPGDADLLYLGGSVFGLPEGSFCGVRGAVEYSHVEGHRDPPNNQIIRIYNMLSTHGLVITSQNGLDALRSALSDPATEYHMWDVFAAKIQRSINAYAVDPAFVYQTGGNYKNTFIGINTNGVEQNFTKT